MTQPPETPQNGTSPLDPELIPLLRLLSRAKGFALAFLKCNVPVERERLVEVLSQTLKERGRSGRVLHLQEPVIDLLEHIKAQDPPLGAEDVLFVLGFERSIPAEVDFPPALVKINMARELYRDLPCPLVMVLPDYALTKLAQEAPDFWAWRSGVFEIEARTEELETILERNVRLKYGELLSLSPERVQAHLEVLQELLSEYEARGDSDGQRLDLLMQITRDLESLGNLETALTYAERALELARKLGDVETEAIGLCESAIILSELGRREEALERDHQAVKAFRSLVREDSTASQSNLAISLNNLSNRLRASGFSGEAQEAIEEALKIVRGLVSRDPNKFLPDLAMALFTQCPALKALGRGEEALSAMRESVGIRRRLASENPGLFVPDLALGLDGLGNSLARSGHDKEAIQASKEAVLLYRQLASRRPEVFLPDLARSLGNFAARLGIIGRNEEALLALEEAIRILTPFASRRPAVFQEQIQRYTSRYTALCAEMGREPDPDLLRPLQSVLPAENPAL